MNYKIAIIYIILAVSFLTKYSHGQAEYAWWYNQHNLTDSIHWKKYITISPGFMGPNALPVPDIQNGLIRENLELDFSLDAHFSNGDKTQNMYNQLYLPFAKNNAAFHFYAFPLEHFKMDTSIRNERYARDSSGKGWSGGDIYCGTIIQVLKDFYNLPDITISYYFKFPCGEHYRNARFTDGGTYFFNMAFGKDLSKNKIFEEFRTYCMVGFYGYQTNSNEHFQNDAILFGLGFDAAIKNYRFSNSIGGYRGYLDNRDKPVVYRANITKLNKYVNYRFSYQLGIRHINYNSFRISAIVHFNRDNLKFPFTNNKP